MKADSRLSFVWKASSFFAVVLAAVVPYLGTLDAPFVFDDVKLVKENKLLRTAWDDPMAMLETFDITSRRWDAEELRPNYRPLRFLSYAIDYRLTRAWFGEVPESGPPVLFFHLTNIILHTLNALLVLVIARSLAKRLVPEDRRDERVAALLGLSVGLLFALHPLQTEAVTYISGRRDVLSAFFYLAAVALYLRDGPEAGPRANSLALVPILFLAGLLSKEIAVTLPAALVLIDLVRGARWNKRRTALHALNAIVAIVFVTVTLSNPKLIATAPAEGLLGTALTACRYTARYLGLSLLPVSQSLDYSFDAIPLSRGLVSPWTTLPATALVLGLVAVAARILLRILRGSSRSAWDAALAFGILWFLGTLVPVLQIVPIAERFAERFAYLPVIGVIFLAAVFIVRLRDFEPLLGWGLLGLLCVLATAGTVRRNGEWKSPLVLWTSAVEAQPRAARAHLGRANALKTESRYREAAQEYAEAIEIFEERPDVPLHHGFLLQALAMRGGVYGLLAAQDPALLDRAIADYRRVLSMHDTDGAAIESSSKYTVLHFELADLYLRKGEKDSAAKEHRRVLEIGSPIGFVGGSHYCLSKIALLNGDPKAAAESLRKAYEVIPKEDPLKFPVAVELADLLIDQKELDAASEMVTRALADGASESMRLHLLTREAKILDRRGDLAACVGALERIIADDPAYAPALLSLAGIESAQGKHDKAEEHYKMVLAADRGNAEALKGLQNVKLLRKLAEEQHGKPPEPNTVAVLEALEKKALQSIAKGQLLAAREEFSSLVNRATAAKRKDFQVRGIRGLAAVEEKLGQWKKAEEGLKAALDLEPSDPGSLRQIADLYFQRFDERALARRYYERYVEALPGGKGADPSVLVNLAEIIGASDPIVALVHLEKARDAGYKEPDLDRAFGYRHADAGHWKDSLDAFNRYFERTRPLDASGREDVVRKAARDFVRENILPRVEE